MKSLASHFYMVDVKLMQFVWSAPVQRTLAHAYTIIVESLSHVLGLGRICIVAKKGHVINFD